MSKAIRRAVVVAAVLAAGCGTEGPEHRLRTDASTRDTDASTVDSAARDGRQAGDGSARSDGGSDGALSDGSTSRTCKTAVPHYVDLKVGGSTTFTTSDGKTHTVVLKSQSLDAVTVTVDGVSAAFDLDENRCGSPGRQLPKNVSGVQVLPEVTSDIQSACQELQKDRRYKVLKVTWETGDVEADKDVEKPGYARLMLFDPAQRVPDGTFPVRGAKTCGQVLMSTPRPFLVPSSYGFHHGVDLYGPVGTPLVAVQGGTLTRVHRDCEAGDKECDGGCGNGVDIENGDFKFHYCHLKNVAAELAVGRAIEVGEPIGDIGLTGLTGSPHLHLNIWHRTGSRPIVSPFPYLHAWCREHTCAPALKVDSPRRVRSFALSSVADAGTKKSGTAYCAAKGLKCLSVDRLWTKADGWRGFESGGGDWYAYGCDKELLTDADFDGKAKVVQCYGQAAASSSDQIQLFGIQDGDNAGGKATASSYCKNKGLVSAGVDWLYAEKDGSDVLCSYSKSTSKWWCAFGTPNTLRSHYSSANAYLAADGASARQVYCTGRDDQVDNNTHAIHQYHLDAASQAGNKSASQLCSERGMTCLGVEWLYREGCAHDDWCTREELDSKVDWGQWKHHRCTDSVGNTKYDGLARVVSCRAPAGD